MKIAIKLLAPLHILGKNRDIGSTVFVDAEVAQNMVKTKQAMYIKVAHVVNNPRPPEASPEIVTKQRRRRGRSKGKK